MVTPSGTKARSQQAWENSIRKYPNLRRFGNNPWDETGELRAEVKEALSKEIDAGGTTRYSVRPPTPVDWGERGSTMLQGLSPAANIRGIGRAFSAIPDMGREFSELVRETKSPPNPFTGEFWGAVGRPLSEKEADFPLFTKTLGTWADILRPGPAFALEHIPGLREPGVGIRRKKLREMGYGPLESAQAGYEQSVEAGEIPLWKEFATEAVVDPIELLPGVGLAGGITKLGARGIAKGAKAVGKKIVRETPVDETIVKTAKKILEEDPPLNTKAEINERIAYIRDSYARTIDTQDQLKLAEELNFLEQYKKGFLENKLEANELELMNLDLEVEGIDDILKPQYPRPPWAAGLTDHQLRRMADAHGVGPLNKNSGEWYDAIDPRLISEAKGKDRAFALASDITKSELRQKRRDVRSRIKELKRESKEFQGDIQRSPSPLSTTSSLPPRTAEVTASESKNWMNLPFSIRKLSENLWDQFSGLKELESGMTWGKRVKPKRVIGTKENPSLIDMIAAYPGIGSRAAAKFVATFDEAKSKILIDTPGGQKVMEDFNKNMEDILAIKHSREVFAAYKERDLYGQYTRKGIKELDADLRARLGEDGMAQLEESAKVIRDRYAKYLDEFQKEGMINPDLAKELKEKYGWYNPLHYIDTNDAKSQANRSLAKRPGQEARIPLKRLSRIKDKEEFLENPFKILESVIMANEHRIATNRIKRTVIRLAIENKVPGIKPIARDIGYLGKRIAVEPGAEPVEAIFRRFRDPEGTISFFDPAYTKADGSPLVYEVPDWISREIEFLYSGPGGGSNKMLVPLAMFNRFRRAMLTSYNPAFTVANSLNDMFVIFASRRILPHKVITELARTFKGLENDPFFRAYTFAGGRQQKYFGELSEEIIRRSVKNEQKVSIPTIVSKLNKYTFQQIPKVGEKGELAPRLAAAKKKLDELMPEWRDNLGTDAEVASGAKKMTAEQLAETPEMAAAVTDALEATINFSRGGRTVRWLNQYILFLNAAMEGMKLPIRAAQNQGFRRFSGTLGSLVLGQMGLTYWNMQYPEYFNISLDKRLSSVYVMIPDFISEKDKDVYGRVIPKPFLVTPKTREFSPFLGAATYIMEKMYKESPVAATAFVRTLIPEVTPLGADVTGGGNQGGGKIMGLTVPLPEALESYFEQKSGMDFYRNRPIVPTSLQNLPDPEQHFPWTSPTLKSIANSIEGKGIKGRVWGAAESVYDPLDSPLMLNHLFDSLFGGFGREFLNASDLIHDLMREDPELRIQELTREYSDIEDSIERKAFITSLDQDEKEAVLSEYQKVSKDVYRKTPILGSVSQRIIPEIRPSADQKLKTEIAARETGTDSKQTDAVYVILADFYEGSLADKKDADTTVDLDDNSLSGITARTKWRESRQAANSKIGGVREVIEDQYPGSIQAADIETRNMYYSIKASTGEETRTRQQMLLAGYNSIQPSDVGLSDTDIALGLLDLDMFYKERENYKSNLSEDDRQLLEEALDSNRTPVDIRYNDDIDYIRSTGFWDIIPQLVQHYNLGPAWKKYKSLRGRERKEFLNSEEARVPGRVGGLKDIISYASKKRDEIRLNNYNTGGKLDQLLIYWGFYQKPIKEKYPFGVIHSAGPIR